MSRLFILIAIINWGMWAFFSKLASKNLHPIQQQLIVNLVYVLQIPLFVWIIQRNSIGYSFPSKGILFASLSAVCGLVAVFSYTYALQKSDVGVVTSLSSTYVVLTYVLSVIFLNESLTLQKVLGILTILFGTFLLGR